MINLERTSLNLLTFKASSWIAVGYGFSQFQRFIGNLILTRILFPEDFGIMQLVNVFVQGLYMFSDLGVGMNVLRHPRGEDSTFLRTAWTIQVYRGFIMWIATILISWPLATLYGVPKLIWMLPIAGFTTVLDGFVSMSLLVLNRRMDMFRITLLEVYSQTIGVVAMVACAWYWQSVWALLVASLVAATVKVIVSNVSFPHPRMGFEWDKESRHEILHFGKWIFFSTITNFLMSRLDRIILGLYLSLTDLGYYGIALGISLAFVEGVYMVTSKVLTPLYSQLLNFSEEQRKRKIFNVRLALMLVTLPPLYCLAIWGKQVIAFLYPHNYQEAGWMLQIISAGYTLKVITAGLNPYFLVLGDTYKMMITQLTQAIILLTCLLFAGTYLGLVGLIVATVIPDILNYPILAYNLWRDKGWQPLLDFSAMAISVVIIALGIGLS